MCHSAARIHVVQSYVRALVALHTAKATELCHTACRYVDGGSDVAKFHFPQAVAATRGFVYVADHENNRIRSVAVDTGACMRAAAPN